MTTGKKETILYRKYNDLYHYIHAQQIWVGIGTEKLNSEPSSERKNCNTMLHTRYSSLWKQKTKSLKRIHCLRKLVRLPFNDSIAGRLALKWPHGNLFTAKACNLFRSFHLSQVPQFQRSEMATCERIYAYCKISNQRSSEKFNFTLHKVPLPVSQTEHVSKSHHETRFAMDWAAVVSWGSYAQTGTKFLNVEYVCKVETRDWENLNRVARWPSQDSRNSF